MLFENVLVLSRAQKKKCLQKIHVIMQASLPHGENDAIDPQFLMCQWQRGMLEALEGLHM